jgi:AraC-like DNA-binding protein
MQATALLEGGSLSVYRYRCTAGPDDKPYAEVHPCHSISYVRSGSFGCVTLGAEHEMVAGSVMIGRPGQEYMATHEHHGCGDECLSVKLAPGTADLLNLDKCELAALAPLPELMVLGELALAAAGGLDEAAMLFVERVVGIASGKRAGLVRASARERRRAVETALWLEANLAEPVGLEDAARQAGFSPFHVLRLFRNVIGVTPHQYLLRVRLREAARLLADPGRPITEIALDVGFADLSNFVRTFRRAAGMPPGAFRKNFQDRAAVGR